MDTLKLLGLFYDDLNYTLQKRLNFHKTDKIHAFTIESKVQIKSL
jgi:hypothetical protein